MMVLKNFEGSTLPNFVRETIEEGSVVITDGALGHRSTDKFGYTHDLLPLQPAHIAAAGAAHLPAARTGRRDGPGDIRRHQAAPPRARPARA